MRNLKKILLVKGKDSLRNLTKVKKLKEIYENESSLIFLLYL